MWIATTDGFFSIACGYRMIDGVPTPDRGVMMIRARRRSHLERLRMRFPGLGEVKTEAGTDYPHRIICDRQSAIAVVHGAISSVHYNNFKKAATEHNPQDDAYHHFLIETWSAGLRMEDVPPPRSTMKAGTTRKKSATRKKKGTKRR